MKKQKPDPKRPQLWMGYPTKDSKAIDRIRILYPDGTAEFAYDKCDWVTPCWWFKIKGRATMKSMTKAMNKYLPDMISTEFVANL